MQTIEEHNKEAEESPVSMRFYAAPEDWEPHGVMCPCGCKQELLWLPNGCYGFKIWKDRIKCQATGKTGHLLKDGTIRGIIKGLEWDK